AFFGEGWRTDRLVAHAASFGSYYSDAPLEQCWRECLRRFEAISVRDHHSSQLVHESVGAYPPLVLDPCLQFNVGPDPGTPSENLVVYGHNFSPAFVDGVTRWARERGRHILSVGYRNDWADEQWIDASPEEFAGAIASAAAVATNFFHGCVFALRYAKPFACEAMGYRWHKVQSLVSAVGAQAQLASADADASFFEHALSSAPAAHVRSALERMRNESDAYLDDALA